MYHYALLSEETFPGSFDPPNEGVDGVNERVVVIGRLQSLWRRQMIRAYLSAFKLASPSTKQR